jgi:hypothetical protein
VRFLLAIVSAWFPLTSVPSVATIDWRCGTKGEQLIVRLTPPVATTTIVFRGHRRVLNGGSFRTGWLNGPATIELIQGTEARTIDAELNVQFRPGDSYCRPYLPPAFVLAVSRR